MQSNRAKLDQIAEKTWGEILDNSRFVRWVMEGKMDKRGWATYLVQTYHYTLHNSRNQAMVGVTMASGNPQYQKFCFEHAMEETGHELMALHDASSLGFSKEELVQERPLPETEVLIAYLYWISAKGNPLQRLGYSYWAENSYRYIMPMVKKIQQGLELKNSQMTFFIAHSDIDKEHAEEVAQMLDRHCKTEQDWDDVGRVLETSLRLTAEMLEGVYREIQRRPTVH